MAGTNPLPPKPSSAGSFLVAKPKLKDPIFGQSVVLMLQHSFEGAYGLVVNRPAKVENMPFPVFIGGPCESQGLLMLHGHAEWVDPSSESGREVAPGIFLGDASCIERVQASPDDKRYRMIAGYAGWGPGQLEGEIADGAWVIVPASGQVLFETPVEDLWSVVLPVMIPQPSLN
ncbi:MAG: UPF0301 protein [Gemmatales bacterium]|nr:MAG: UPF0301 protein [Gemmatales bacterium]